MNTAGKCAFNKINSQDMSHLSHQHNAIPSSSKAPDCHLYTSVYILTLNNQISSHCVAHACVYVLNYYNGNFVVDVDVAINVKKIQFSDYREVKESELV